MTPHSAALADYLPAFSNPAEPFLTYYSFGPDKSVRCQQLTRGAFWSLACRAAYVLRDHGLSKVDCFAHYFSGNRYEDLAFRLGAIMVGATPVTVNWQADTLERIAFKVDLTSCRLVITDRGTPRKLLDALRGSYPQLEVFCIDQLQSQPELLEDEFCRDIDLDHDAARIIIFTSGTTGQPKGVRLSYRSYLTNRNTFESFLQISDQDKFAPIVTNPMHHTNSTAITDWALRRRRTQLHLFERYSTKYWALLADIVASGHDRTVAPLVSRHFDFLENLRKDRKLPIGLDLLQDAMRRVDFLLGSAPVGPITVGRLQEYTGRIPLVRFGSTETCLQVVGTPANLPEECRLNAFRKGWSHTWNGLQHSGYYIGRPHHGYTETRIVRSIDREHRDYFVDCLQGEPGQLITRGDNLMLGYVNDEAANRQVMHDGGWYTGLGDICFYLTNDRDGQRDYYWMSRKSSLLIRGGAKYSYEQINAELKLFAKAQYGLPDDAFDLAVVGQRITSEHEDDCCVTMELRSAEALAKMTQIEQTFLAKAREKVSKGAKPDHLRFAKIPRNFKGAVLVPQLEQYWSSTIASA